MLGGESGRQAVLSTRSWEGARRAQNRVDQTPNSPTGTGVGTVYLVGAGPGDPGLLTRRGEAVLAGADVVVYDHLASLRLLDLAPPEALRICAGKSVGHCTMP